MVKLEVIYWIAAIPYQMWVFSAMFITLANPKSGPVKWCYHEIKPFVLLLITVMALTCPYGSYFNFMDTASNLYIWYKLKDIDNDDDRWKRRLKKVKEKIQESESRLVVVPESA